MDQSFFIWTALVLGLLFVRVPEAAAPELPFAERQRAAAALLAPVQPAPAGRPLKPAARPLRSSEALQYLEAPQVTAASQSTAASTEQAQAPAGRQPDPAQTPAVDRSAVERLVIPGLEIDAHVFEKPRKGNTWDIAGLRTDVAWLEGTSHPAAGGNTVLAAHIMVRGIGNGPFRYLDRLKAGDVILVYSRENLYVYKVREQVIVKETDWEVTSDTGHPQLTMLTCSDWDTAAETYQRRRAVFADLLRTVPQPEPGAIELFENE